MQALGLVAKRQRGYHRTREDLSPAELGPAFRERVFLVSKLLDAVESGHGTPDAAFEAVEDAIPRWERERDTDWERRWREAVAELLGWAALFGLVTVADGTVEVQ
jgi:hypothetical protein